MKKVTKVASYHVCYSCIYYIDYINYIVLTIYCITIYWKGKMLELISEKIIMLANPKLYIVDGS